MEATMKKLFIFILLLNFLPFVAAMEQQNEMDQEKEELLYQLIGSIDRSEFNTASELLKKIDGDVDHTAPLVFAASLNCYDEALFAALLKKTKDINYKDHNHTPLVTAAKASNIDAVGLLIEAGADVDAPLKESSLAGITPLMATVKWGNSNKIITKLLSAGADVNRQDKKGKTALMYLVQRDFQEIESLFLNYCFRMKRLLTAGAKIKLKDKNGKTAIDHSKHPKLKALLEQEIENLKNIRKRDQQILLFKKKLTKDKGYYASLLPKDVVNKVAQYYENSDI
jgi:ankyrin repeat protein